jgi:hypothetical protein
MANVLGLAEESDYFVFYYFMSLALALAVVNLGFTFIMK